MQLPSLFSNDPSGSADRAVILPILFLLYAEGADRALLLALLYILL